MFKKIFIASIALILAGCGSIEGIPSSSSFPDSSMLKITSSKDWDVIADDVAKQIQSGFHGPQPLYVVHADDSDFSEGFHSMLVSHLVNNGLDVVTSKNGAAVLIYKAQVVRHYDGRGDYPNAGEVAELAGGILVARQIAVSHASSTAKAASGLAVLAGAAVAEKAIRAHSPTNTEVIITTSITNGERYLERNTSVYYVPDTDESLYDSSTNSTRRMEVIEK